MCMRTQERGGPLSPPYRREDPYARRFDREPPPPAPLGRDHAHQPWDYPPAPRDGPWSYHDRRSNPQGGTGIGAGAAGGGGRSNDSSPPNSHHYDAAGGDGGAHHGARGADRRRTSERDERHDPPLLSPTAGRAPSAGGSGFTGLPLSSVSSRRAFDDPPPAAYLPRKDSLAGDAPFAPHRKESMFDPPPVPPPSNLPRKDSVFDVAPIATTGPRKESAFDAQPPQNSVSSWRDGHSDMSNHSMPRQTSTHELSRDRLPLLSPTLGHRASGSSAWDPKPTVSPGLVAALRDPTRQPALPPAPPPAPPRSSASAWFDTDVPVTARSASSAQVSDPLRASGDGSLPPAPAPSNGPPTAAADPGGVAESQQRVGSDSGGRRVGTFPAAADPPTPRLSAPSMLPDLPLKAFNPATAFNQPPQSAPAPSAALHATAHPSTRPVGALASTMHDETTQDHSMHSMAARSGSKSPARSEGVPDQETTAGVPAGDVLHADTTTQRETEIPAVAGVTGFGVGGLSRGFEDGAGPQRRISDSGAAAANDMHAAAFGADETSNGGLAAGMAGLAAGTQSQASLQQQQAQQRRKFGLGILRRGSLVPRLSNKESDGVGGEGDGAAAGGGVSADGDAAMEDAAPHASDGNAPAADAPSDAPAQHTDSAAQPAAMHHVASVTSVGRTDMGGPSGLASPDAMAAQPSSQPQTAVKVEPAAEAAVASPAAAEPAACVTATAATAAAQAASAQQDVAMVDVSGQGAEAAAGQPELQPAAVQPAAEPELPAAADLTTQLESIESRVTEAELALKDLLSRQDKVSTPLCLQLHAHSAYLPAFTSEASQHIWYWRARVSLLES